MDNIPPFQGDFPSTPDIEDFQIDTLSSEISSPDLLKSLISAKFPEIVSNPIPSVQVTNDATETSSVKAAESAALPRKRRELFTDSQKAVLTKVFKKQRYVSPQEREFIALRTGLTTEQVKIWFQNMRYKAKFSKNGPSETQENNKPKYVPKANPAMENESCEVAKHESALTGNVVNAPQKAENAPFYPTESLNPTAPFVDFMFQQGQFNFYNFPMNFPGFFPPSEAFSQFNNQMPDFFFQPPASFQQGWDPMSQFWRQ